MTATYRGTADEIAKGVPLREMWGEVLGKADRARRRDAADRCTSPTLRTA